ncbi:hypothetical protein ILYODFUR_000854 [Ilyodon furcidens]|uniref:Uncharacterized protein n=1 Tax=Ilyodon furcidens TaxID=33524 RepID=A0ABV0T480_9TELE
MNGKGRHLVANKRGRTRAPLLFLWCPSATLPCPSASGLAQKELPFSTQPKINPGVDYMEVNSRESLKILGK